MVPKARRAPREAGFTEQRSPPALFGGRITSQYSTGPTTPPQPLSTQQPPFPSFCLEQRG
uniref:Uncharacterized protein n=1 Tax=Vitis vinifera TaxID=29760 RepID=F6H568_VITVI